MCIAGQVSKRKEKRKHKLAVKAARKNKGKGATFVLSKSPQERK
jgi:hypothetical protein